MKTHTQLWLIRHGETDWNAQMRIQGSIDIGLNAAGVRQAHCIARYFGAHLLEAIYSSHLSRAIETARPLAEASGITLQTEPDWAERRFGAFEGLTINEIRERCAQQYDNWQARDPEFRPEGGETLREFEARIRAALLEMVRRHPRQSVAVFTHGGVLDMVYRIAKRLPIEVKRAWPIDNAGIQELKGTEEGFEVAQWGIREHLA